MGAYYKRSIFINSALFGNSAGLVFDNLKAVAFEHLDECFFIQDASAAGTADVDPVAGSALNLQPGLHLMLESHNVGCVLMRPIGMIAQQTTLKLDIGLPGIHNLIGFKTH